MNSFGSGERICNLKSNDGNVYKNSSPSHLDYSDGKFLDYPNSISSDFESYFGTTNNDAIIIRHVFDNF